MRKFMLGLVMGAFVLTSCGPKKPAQSPGAGEAPVMRIPQPSQIAEQKPPAPPAEPSSVAPLEAESTATAPQPLISETTTKPAPPAPAPTPTPTKPEPQKPASPPPAPSPKPSKPAKPTPSPTPSIGQQTFVYRVQLFAFTSYRRANDVLLQLKKKFPSYEFIIQPEDNLYKVQVGNFATRAEAEDVKDFFKKKGYTDAFIVGVMTALP